MKKKPRYSIIIPTCDHTSLLYTCVMSIKANTDDYEIIIVVNTSNMYIHDRIKAMWSDYDNIKTIHLDNYSGFIKPVECGIKQSKADNICLLNDDIIVGKNWIDDMAKHLKGNVWQVGPSLSYVNGKFNNVKYRTDYPYIEGWCFMVKRKVLSLTENGTLFDNKLQWAYCEDADLSRRIRQSGHKIKRVNINIRHLRAQSRNMSEAIRQKCIDSEAKNKKYLAKKWYKEQVS